MFNRYQRTDHPGFVKDRMTGAVLNMNASEKKLYDLKLAEAERISALQNKVDRLEKLVAALLEAKGV